MDSSSLKIIPLGGCGEIGMNMTLLCISNEYFFIDGGALFPDPSLVGVDLILPDTRFIDENRILPEAWLITHGHEDHIGALVYLYKKYPAPIYATPFAIELIKSKFEDAHISEAHFKVWKFFEPFLFKNMKVTVFPVNHSIAEASVLFIETKFGNILHMGDFRIDPHTPEKRATHENIIQVTKGKKVTLMMSDSTNSFQSGTDLSESEVLPNLMKYLQTAQGVVIIATFASNIWRLKNIFEAASNTGRKIALFGRSLLRNTEIANRIGLLDTSKYPLIDMQDILQYPRNKICILCTGSQGENFSGLYRIASNNVSEFKVKENDLVLFSSRIIPGNEKAIETLITQLEKMDCQVITTKEDRGIHVSGHGYQEDLITCIKIANPLYFLPIHGTYRHLKKHRDLAILSGVRAENCFLAENGVIISIDDKKKRILGSVTTGRDYVCPGGIFSPSSQIYKDRVALIYGGVVAVSFVFEGQGYQLLTEPVVSFKGVPLNSADFAKKIPVIFEKIYENSIKRKKFSENFLQEELKIGLRRYLEKRLNYKTNVIVLFQRF